MTAPIPFALTHESLTVVISGKSHTVKEGAPNYAELRAAVLDRRWADVPKHLTVKAAVESWAKGKFKIQGDVVTYEGEQLPQSLTRRIVEMTRDRKDPSMFFRFWERLKKNPSPSSVKQLWDFLQHRNIPLAEDGYVLAYKAVRADYKDMWTGTLDNSVGRTVTMPREKVTEDPNTACAPGLHCGSISYAEGYKNSGGRIVIVRVDPMDAVSVPLDSNTEKMRVCRYTVLGNYGSKLPDTTFKEEKADYEEPKPSAKPSTPAAISRPKKKGKSRFNLMDASELMEQSIADLRTYAFKKLKIVGASKIPGGKAALISRILDVNRK